MSDGETTGSKKPHYTDAYKNRIAELEAQLEAATAGVATIPEAPVPATVTAPDPVVSVDPLAWITEDTPAVFLVSSTSTFFLRHGNPRINPPTESVILQSSSDPRPWGANPFDFRNEDRVMEQNNKVMMSKWHHLRVTQDLAYLYWDHPTAKKPTAVVTDPAKFKGWNRLRKQANGETAPITEFVGLRELVRFLIQKNRMTFMNWGQHTSDFPRSVPNPYSNRLPDIGSAIRSDIDAWKGKTLDSRSPV